MATIIVPTDQPTLSAAIAAAAPGDTIQVLESANGVDTTVTVDGLTFEIAPNQTFTLTLGPGVLDVTLEGAGEVNVIANDAGNDISGNAGANRIVDGQGSDILTGGQEEDTFFISGGNNAVDLGSFAERNATNPSGGPLNASDMDTVAAFGFAGGHDTIVNFTPEEDQGTGVESDQIVFGGPTFSTAPVFADFYVGHAGNSGQAWQGSFTGALSDLGGYADSATDWELTVAIDTDPGTPGYEVSYTFHDLFDATAQAQLNAVLTNTDFSGANGGGMSQVAAADEAALLSAVLAADTEEGVDFAILVDPSRNAAADGQIDLTTGLTAFSTIQAALTVATVGDVLMLVPGDHTFGGTVPGVLVNVESVSLLPLQSGAFTLPSFALDTGVESFTSLMESVGVTVNGNASNNDIEGDSGNDTISGGDGDDRIFGSGTTSGTDQLNGGGGDDTFEYVHGRSGTESIDGGSTSETTGDQIQFLSPGPTFDSITLSGSGAGLSIETSGDATPEITATNVEGVSFDLTDGQDSLTLTGDLAAAGINPALARGGVFVSLGNGADTFNASGLTSATPLSVAGGAQDDNITGGLGADLLTGEGGNDTLNGGGGTDTAVYALASSNYSVVFNEGAGTYTVSAMSGDEGTDTLSSIEQLAFSNGAETGAIDDFVDDGGPRSDFTGDGDDDILFLLGGGNKVIGNVGEANLFIGGSDRTARLAGNFDGDDDNDILMELNAGGAYVVENIGAPNTFIGQADRTARAVGDFDGDDDDDILFTLDAGGHHVIGNVGAPNLFIGRSDRSVQATGDFDGDGDDDILMKLTAGGAHVVEKIGEANVFLGAADRTARAVGDFDGDGDDDILMELDGTGAYVIEKVGEANTFVGRADRTVVGVGDFDGDGDDDILMQLDAGGAYVIEKIGEANVFVGRTDRTARAIGDFDGDGDDDILMEIDATGNHVIENVGDANLFVGYSDRDAVDLGLTDLGLAFEVL
ncbi:MAG: hypothetical protein R8J41_05890 [Alphaproteobacteria bacterium]|nr:hypothetical protein [Alphaproteobacteria bacterium]